MELSFVNLRGLSASAFFLQGIPTHSLSNRSPSQAHHIPAARPRRNRCPVWARPRMAKERTDLIGRLWRKNMLKLAGLLLDLGFAVHGQAVGKQPLSQPVSPDDAPRPLASSRRQLDNQCPVS